MELFQQGEAFVGMVEHAETGLSPCGLLVYSVVVS